MAEVTVIVEFEIVEGREREFGGMMAKHARLTLEEEPGCRRFEVVRPEDPNGSEDLGRLLVNELYADEAAYEAHKANPRMPDLQASTAPLVRSRRLIVAKALGIEAADDVTRPEDLNASNDD